MPCFFSLLLFSRMRYSAFNAWHACVCVCVFLPKRMAFRWPGPIAIHRNALCTFIYAIPFSTFDPSSDVWMWRHVYCKQRAHIIITHMYATVHCSIHLCVYKAWMRTGVCSKAICQRNIYLFYCGSRNVNANVVQPVWINKENPK